MTYSVGISWVNLQNSSVRLTEEGLGSHARICRRKSMTFANGRSEQTQVSSKHDAFLGSGDGFDFITT